MPFEKGNKYGHGRPKRPEVEELRQALKAAKKKKGVSFLNDYVEKSYNDSPRAIALLKKIVPDLVEGDVGDKTLDTFGDIIKKAINASP